MTSLAFPMGLLLVDVVAPQAARADCQTLTGNNQTVICTGADLDGLSASFNGITVNVLDGATVRSNSDGIILAGTGDTINAFGTSTISTDSATDTGIVINGANATITLNDQASVTHTGIFGVGVSLIGNNGQIIMNDSSSVATTKDSSHGAQILGDNGSITLNDHAAISTLGTGSYGIQISGTGNEIVIGEDASVTSAGTFSNAVNLGNGSNTLTNHGEVTSALGNAILGDNNAANSDTIKNYGTISGSGIAVNLQDGDDFLVLGTGSRIIGDISGGAGVDEVTLNGTGSEDDDFSGFEILTMDGDNWSISGTSTFSTAIDIVSGRLAINGNITSPTTTLVAGGILGGSGTLTGDIVSTGAIAPGNSVGTLTVVGAVIQTGGAFDVEFDKSGIDLLTATGAVTLNGAPAVNVSPLRGAAGANGVFLHSDTSITGAIGTTDYAGNGAATLVQGANDISVIAIDGTPLVAANFAAVQTGMDYLGTVNGAQLDQSVACADTTCAVPSARHIWARGFGRFGDEYARDGNQGYDYRSAGTALGGDIAVLSGLKLGGSVGYANTETNVAHNAARADIDGEFAALYATYENGGIFVTGVASGGLQQFDLSRKVAVAGGTDTARAETDGWLAGGSLQTGLKLDFAGGWRLTPSAGIAYQHQSVDGYSEGGAGAGNVDMGDQDSDALRLNAQFNVARTIPFEGFTLIPHIRVGVAEQINFGDKVNGAFSNGSDFTLAQQDDNRLIGLGGAGIDLALANGVTANLDYEGQYANDSEQHAIMAGISLTW